MKNRILILISIILTVVSCVVLDVLNVWWAWVILGVTLLAQLWCLIVNKNNWAVKIGNYSLWLTVLTAIVGFILGRVLPPGEWGFGPAFSALIYSAMVGFALVTISFLSFIIGAFLKDKVTVPQ